MYHHHHHLHYETFQKRKIYGASQTFIILSNSACAVLHMPVLWSTYSHGNRCAHTFLPYSYTVSNNSRMHKVQKHTHGRQKSGYIYTMSELIPFLYTNWDLSYARTPALIFHHESHISPVLDSNCSTVEYCVPGHFRTGSCVTAI
jgi:hypothetical protein